MSSYMNQSSLSNLQNFQTTESHIAAAYISQEQTFKHPSILNNQQYSCNFQSNDLASHTRPQMSIYPTQYQVPTDSNLIQSNLIQEQHRQAPVFSLHPQQNQAAGVILSTDEIHNSNATPIQNQTCKENFNFEHMFSVLMTDLHALKTYLNIEVDKWDFKNTLAIRSNVDPLELTLETIRDSETIGDPLEVWCMYDFWAREEPMPVGAKVDTLHRYKLCPITTEIKSVHPKYMCMIEIDQIYPFLFMNSSLCHTKDYKAMKNMALSDPTNIDGFIEKFSGQILAAYALSLAEICVQLLWFNRTYTVVDDTNDSSVMTGGRYLPGKSRCDFVLFQNTLAECVNATRTLYNMVMNSMDTRVLQKKIQTISYTHRILIVQKQRLEMLLNTCTAQSVLSPSSHHLYKFLTPPEKNLFLATVVSTHKLYRSQTRVQFYQNIMLPSLYKSCSRKRSSNGEQKEQKIPALLKSNIVLAGNNEYEESRIITRRVSEAWFIMPLNSVATYDNYTHIDENIEIPNLLQWSSLALLRKNSDIMNE